MKDINVKERIAAIRKAHTYGPTPLEEAILCLIEDLTDAKEEQPQEPAVVEVKPIEEKLVDPVSTDSVNP